MNVDLLVTFVMRLLVATAEILFLFLCSLPGFTTPVFSRFFFSAHPSGQPDAGGAPSELVISSGSDIETCSSYSMPEPTSDE